MDRAGWPVVKELELEGEGIQKHLGEVPEDWRVADVVPLFKKGCKEKPGNYRPVSLTSVVDKLFKEVTKSIDEYRAVDVIDMDFRKAFDRILHSRLMNKVRSLGIQGMYRLGGLATEMQGYRDRFLMVLGRAVAVLGQYVPGQYAFNGASVESSEGPHGHAKFPELHKEEEALLCLLECRTYVGSPGQVIGYCHSEELDAFHSLHLSSVNVDG
eukprot:g44072.t1